MIVPAILLIFRVVLVSKDANGEHAYQTPGISQEELEIWNRPQRT